MSIAALNRRGNVWWWLRISATSLAIILSGIAANAQSTKSSIASLFDIPAQPLRQALQAYSVTTGLEIFYNAALAEGRRSTSVSGVLTQSAALKVLLRGTGYVPRLTGTDSFTIVAAPRFEAGRTTVETTDQRYGLFFAAMQARIGAALCRYPARETASDEFLFKIWLEPSGTISRAELLNAGGVSASGHAIADSMSGLSIGRSLPRGMPQPVTLVIFPPATLAANDCLAPSIDSAAVNGQRQADRPDVSGKSAGTTK